MTTQQIKTSEDQTFEPVMRRVELVPLGSSDIEGYDDFEPLGPTPPGFFRRHWIFLVLFVMPVFLAAVFFGFILSDRYVAEAKYILRSTGHGGGDGLAVVLQSQGMTRAVDETYALNEYMLSRDAADRLSADARLLDVMARPEGDIFTRYPSPFFRQNKEGAYRAFLRFVDIKADNSTGISTLTVQAFRPEDASDLADAMLRRGEDFVNSLNVRSNNDAVGFAKDLVEEAEKRVKSIEERIAVYRNREMVLDPQKESSESMASLGKMATEISRLEATLAQQMAMAPESPTITPLRERIKAYKEQFEKLRRTIVGGPDSIAEKLQGYELLEIERELATKALGASVIELEKARHDASSQRIYLQRIVEPSRPDHPLMPHRMLGWLAVTLLSFAVYRIARSFVASTLDHQA